METGRSNVRRIGSIVLWYALPAVVVAAVIAYILGATVGHANPPAVPVEGTSMRPALQAGDLVILEGVDPRTLRKGDVIALHVPTQQRQEYGLPANVVHRIVQVKHDSLGRFFVTKGDANAGPDAFNTRPAAVIGKMVAAVPGLGYPLLFFRSRQGEIFLAACLLVAVSYFLLGVVEERRAYVEGTAVTMEALLSDTRELKETLTTAQTLAAPAAITVETEELSREVRAARAQSEETSATMRELVGAVGEYGQHLRSHTAVMQNLAETTAELTRAAAALGRAAPAPAAEETAAPALPPPVAAPAPARAPSGADDLPLSLPPDLLARRASLAARTERVDRLLGRLGGDPQ